jgi:hypothetical protein
MNMFLMRPPGFLTSETMFIKTMCQTIPLGQLRGRHGLLKCGSTWVILELRIHSIEALVICVLMSTFDVNFICL